MLNTGSRRSDRVSKPHALQIYPLARLKVIAIGDQLLPFVLTTVPNADRTVDLETRMLF